MPAPDVYCAGDNIRDLPGKNIDYVLVNVVDNFATDGLAKETNKKLQYANPINEIIDSGGYPLLNAEKNGKKIIHDKTKPINYKGAFNFTPHHVVDVVRKQRPHEFVAADFPVRKLSDTSQQETEFKRKKKINVPWAKETSKLWQKYCPDVKLLLALQCYNLNQAEEYYRSIDGIKFSGISMPVRNMKLPEIGLIMQEAGSWALIGFTFWELLNFLRWLWPHIWPDIFFGVYHWIRDHGKLEPRITHISIRMTLLGMK